MLARAADHAGGAENLLKLSSVEVRVDGWRSTALDGFRPPGRGAPRRDTFGYRATLDFAAKRYRQEGLVEFGGGYRNAYGDVAMDGMVHSLSHADRERSVAPGDGAFIVSRAARLVPPLLLQRALTNLATVRRGDRARLGAEALDTIEYAWDNRTRHRLLVDASGAVRALEFLVGDELAGVVAQRVTYLDPRRVDDIVVPRRIVEERGSRTIYDQRVTHVRFGAPAADGAFAVPRDYALTTPIAAPRVSDVAPGVAYVEGIAPLPYGVPVVEFDTFLVVFDAPLNAEFTAAALDEIAKRWPDKPVRYAVISHFHSDHVGGVRTYVDRDVTLVVVPEHEAAVRRVAYTANELLGIRAAPARREIRVVHADPVHVIEEGARRLEIRDFGPVPHVDHLLYAYDATTETVIEADLYSKGIFFNATYGSFLDWLESQARPVRRVLGVHHGPVTAVDIAARKSAHADADTGLR